MIKVKLTENYTGFNIEGTWDDFYTLYDNIDAFLGEDECKDIIEEEMRLHIFGFLYDLRHAYQGDRYVYAVDNKLCEEKRGWYDIKKSVKQDIIYAFDYLVPDLILDVLLFKHFVNRNAKNLSEYDVNYTSVISFYSKVIESLSEITSEIQLNKIKRLLSDSSISQKYFVKQWFDEISKKYIFMNKNRRKKEIMRCIDSICHSYNYGECEIIRKACEKFAKEHDCLVTEIETGKEYPEEIEW